MAVRRNPDVQRRTVGPQAPLFACGFQGAFRAQAGAAPFDQSDKTVTIGRFKKPDGPETVVLNGHGQGLDPDKSFLIVRRAA